VESKVHSALRSPMAYCASPGWLWWWRNWWNDWQGKPKYSEKTCPSAALSTTNPTCCPDANPGRRGGKPMTNRLSYGTALIFQILSDVTEMFQWTFFFFIYVSGSNYLDVTGYFVACATCALSCGIYTRHRHQLYCHCVSYSISLEMSLNVWLPYLYSLFQY
jgi:hypothetical protein